MKQIRPLCVRLQTAFRLRVILLATSAIGTFHAASGFVLAENQPPLGVQALRIREHSRELQRAPVKERAISLSVNIDGIPSRLDLQGRSLRSENFELLVQQPDGEFVAVEAPPAQVYRGTVASMPGSKIAATLTEDGKLTAAIRSRGGKTWYIEPAGNGGVAAAGGETPHYVYAETEAPVEARGCGVGEAPANAVASADSIAPQVVAGSVTRVCDIAFDADVEFFASNGSSVEQTLNDIENVLNGVALIYESELNITYELVSVRIRTAEPDPYTATGADPLLNQFKAEWNANQKGVHRDIAHLMTGKNIDGTTIGIAFYDGICDSCAASGYGVSQSKFSSNLSSRVCLTAHELGHNWGAPHCDAEEDCGLMCSSLGGCGNPCSQVDESSRADILATIAPLTCLANLAPPLSFPFCETFDGGLNNGAWNYVAGAAVATSAINTPSPPFALRIDDCCTQCANGPDEVRSSVIPLAGVPQATLWYSTQHAGGAGTAGSELVVEYLRNDQDWIEVNRITSNGVNQTQFESWSHVLPATARHAEFRIRFRLEPASTGDIWYVDDVGVGGGLPQEPTLYVRAGAAADGDGASWATPFKDLQSALSLAACSGGVVEEVKVAEGTYKPDGGSAERALSFRLPNGVALVGGFPSNATSGDLADPASNETILSGEIGIVGFVGDNTHHVVTATGISDAVLEGFTITGGMANSGTPDGGGGMNVVTSSLTVRDCTFNANRGFNGGAVQIASNASVMMDRCTFMENAANSSGGAVNIGSACTFIIDHSMVLGNSAEAFGGGIYGSAGLIDVGNTFLAGNTASSGAAIYNQLGSAIVGNTTIAGNVAAGSVGGMLNSNGSASVDNSILWGNRDISGTVQSSQYSGPAGSIRYSSVQGWTGSLGGTGNALLNPLFVDLDGPDNDIGTADDSPLVDPTSSIIDAGNPNYVPSGNDSYDLSGTPRLICDRVDMGAVEAGLFDFNCDAVSDELDVAGWPVCLLGPLVNITNSSCRALDVDVNGSIDLRDFSEFQQRPPF